MLDLIPGRVMIFGTFDVFHPGHRFFIEEAKKKGHELVIVVARDRTVKKLKPVLRNPESFRLQVVRNAFLQSTVILGDEKDQMKAVKEYCPSLVCLGYDQVGFSDELQKNFPEIRMERIKAFQPEKYKESQ